MKPSFTTNLKALLLGGAMALSTHQNARAAAATTTTPESKDSSLEARVAKIRQALEKESSQAMASGMRPSADGAGLMWWRNAWGNGGWHNWGNGWHNWHNGGWGNWHNW